MGWCGGVSVVKNDRLDECFVWQTRRGELSGKVLFGSVHSETGREEIQCPQKEEESSLALRARPGAVRRLKLFGSKYLLFLCYIVK